MTGARVVEVSGESAESFDQAIEVGLDRARSTLDDLESVRVADQQILLDEAGGISRYRVRLEVTLRDPG